MLLFFNKNHLKKNFTLVVIYVKWATGDLFSKQLGDEYSSLENDNESCWNLLDI